MRANITITASLEINKEDYENVDEDGNHYTASDDAIENCIRGELEDSYPFNLDSATIEVILSKE